MEDGEVHERVGGEEEVGGDDGDFVEAGDHAEAKGDHEAEDVSAPGVVVGVAPLREEEHAWVDLVHAHGLWWGKWVCFIGIIGDHIKEPSRQSVAV